MYIALNDVKIASYSSLITGSTGRCAHDLVILINRNTGSATYFPGKINDVFAKYFKDAGFTVRGMEGIEVPFDKVQELSGEQVYGFIKRHFLKHKGADAIYMLGSGWRTLNIIKTLEQDLQVPVVHPVTARVWEIQKRLHVREPRAGFGHLLDALP